MKMQRKQFRIGELAKSLGVEKFVIRFWEKEFNFNAHRSKGGQRFYEEQDLKRFHYVKTLLYNEGFTIAGAKKKIKEDGKSIVASKRIIPKKEKSNKLYDSLVALKKDLIAFRDLI